jgi:hypothetical protein
MSPARSPKWHDPSSRDSCDLGFSSNRNPRLSQKKKEILAIENHQLDYTFLHVAFGSQSLLKSTGDQTGSNTI